MARIQILELPDEEGDDGKIVTPFAIIIDQHGHTSSPEIAEEFARFREQCGARGIMIFPGVMDIPSLTAEEIATINQRSPVGTAVVDVVPNLMGFADAIRETVQALGPQKISVYVGDREITDVIRAEMRDKDNKLEDGALRDGRD